MLQVFLEGVEPESCTSVRQVFSSGEALSPELQSHFFQRMEAGLHNLYGPTEAAIEVSYWHCIRADLQKDPPPPVPIGRPIANTRLYVLNPSLQPLPPKVPGELFIGGAGLARGYLNRPGLTAETFIPNPFAIPGDTTSWDSRLYRTGDLVRLVPRKQGNGSEDQLLRDPALEFLGRIDHQVKLRGFRIELGEIEARLRELETVVEAAVLLREDRPGHAQLTGYVVCSNPSGQTPIQELPQLKQALSDTLPDFMIPTHLIALDAMPLNPKRKTGSRGPARSQYGGRPFPRGPNGSPRGDRNKTRGHLGRFVGAYSSEYSGQFFRSGRSFPFGNPSHLQDSGGICHGGTPVPGIRGTNPRGNGSAHQSRSGRRRGKGTPPHSTHAERRPSAALIFSKTALVPGPSGRLKCSIQPAECLVF